MEQDWPREAEFLRTQDLGRRGVRGRPVWLLVSILRKQTQTPQQWEGGWRGDDGALSADGRGGRHRELLPYQTHLLCA